MNDLIVEMKNITKKFPGVVALDNVYFSLMKGEIHALLGENGAGKTTLMRILYGLVRPDYGEIYIRGKKAKIETPKDAIRYKIGMVHQHFMLIDTLSVAENIALSYDEGFSIPFEKIKKKLESILKTYNLAIDPDSKIWQLSVGERQRVEIVKALYGGAEILILDEPTSVLSPIEVEELFKALIRMKEEGKSIVFITHKLDEATKISDRITVLRKGKVVGVVKPNEVSKSDLIKMMVGKEIVSTIIRKNSTNSSIPLLEVKDIHVLNDKGFKALDGLTFELYQGEILGIAGIAGNGQSELAEAIIGVRKVQKGEIRFLGKNITNKSTNEILKLGVSIIPEDRIRQGIALSLSVAENLLVSNQEDRRFSKFFTINYEELYKAAKEAVEKFKIVAPSIKVQAGYLSGGNLQKLLVARSAMRKPKLLIACNPTSGLDVASVSLVHDWLNKLREEKVGILLISEDLEEVLELSNRVIVLKNGRISGSFSGKIEAKEVAVAMVRS